jgi:ubiquinone/menaquinone biosynthesis C-methylase UbiE
MADPLQAPALQGAPLRDRLLPLLRCPFCGGPFAFDECPRPTLGRAEFGLLRCKCSEFPVLDGIPVIQRGPVGMLEHTRGRHESEPVPIAALVDGVRRGDAEKALLACLALPALPPRVAKTLGWRLTHARLGRRAARWYGERRFRRAVLVPRDEIGACEVLTAYFLSGGPLEPAVGHYFLRRFGQPRHLAALSLAASVPSTERPILDIACGIGHLAHYFGSRADRADVVGLDMNFYHLWIARHWMAPGGSYVCADASDGLPFADASFSSVICSDAFHYIGNRARLIREIARCAPQGSVILTRVGNAAVWPNEGDENTLGGYLDELGVPELHAFDEATLVRSYLRRVDPYAAAPPRTDLEQAKWLSFAWNVPAHARRALATDAMPPHAVGRLCLNPMYAGSPGADGNVRLRFEFPLVWFAYENHAMLGYHPRQALVSRQQLATMRGGGNATELRALIDSFVLIGVPERFARSTLATSTRAS